MKFPGGKGINVSRVLNQLGADNTAIGFLGGFTGRYIDEMLGKEGIRTDFVNIADDTRINVKLKHGDETEINGLGPIIREEETNELLHKLSQLQAGDIVVLSGSVPPSLGPDFYGLLIEACRKCGAEFVMDTTGEALMKALAWKPLLVKPNHHELAELFGVVINSSESLWSTAESCSRKERSMFLSPWPAKGRCSSRQIGYITPMYPQVQFVIPSVPAIR